MFDVLISVVITTHNRSIKILNRALQSVLKQTYPHFEIIVVDDSDFDYVGRACIKGFVLELSRKDNRISYVQHCDCRGLSVARNTGIDNSNGEYIAFLDDDDEWLPEKLSRQVSKFLSKDVALVYCGGYQLSDVTGEIEKIQSRYCRGSVFYELLKGNWIGYPSFVMFSKKALIEVGGFDENIPYMEDFDLYLRLSKIYHIDYVNDYLAIYHEHFGEQLSDSAVDYFLGLKYMMEKYSRYIVKFKDIHNRWVERISEAKKELGM